GGRRQPHRDKRLRPSTDQRHVVTQLPSPREDLVAVEPVPDSHRRGACPWRVTLSHDPRLLRARPAPAPRHPADHLHPPKAVRHRCTITVQTRHWTLLLRGPDSSFRYCRSQGGVGATLTVNLTCGRRS